MGVRIACAPLQACARQVNDLQHTPPGSKKFADIGPKTAGIPPCENFSPRRKITARSGGKSSENPGENTSKPAEHNAVLKPKTAWRLRTHARIHARACAGPTAPHPPYCGFCGGLSGDRWGEINYSGRNAGGGCGTQEIPQGVCWDAPQHGDREGLLRNHLPRTHARGVRSREKPGGFTETGENPGNQLGFHESKKRHTTHRAGDDVRRG